MCEPDANAFLIAGAGYTFLPFLSGLMQGGWSAHLFNLTNSNLYWKELFHRVGSKAVATVRLDAPDGSCIINFFAIGDFERVLVLVWLL